MVWGLWKSLASALLYCTLTSPYGRLQTLSSSSVTFFRASISLKHPSFDELRLLWLVRLSTRATLSFDLTSVIRDRSSKVETDLYWSLEDGPESWFKSSGIITEWLLLLLVALDIPTHPGVKWTGHSLRRDGASAAHAVGVSIAVIMTWVLWKSLASALLYIDVSVCPSSEAFFFFGHLLSHFNHLEAPVLRQTTPSMVSSSIDLSDALEALLELDD